MPQLIMDQQGFSSHCSNDMFMAAMEKQFYAEAALWIPLLRHGADMDHQKSRVLTSF